MKKILPILLLVVAGCATLYSLYLLFFNKEAVPNADQLNPDEKQPDFGDSLQDSPLDAGYSITDFDSPDVPGSGENMTPVTLEMYEALSEHLGYYPPVTSGYRTKAHNTKVGGAKASSHLTGKAFDITFESKEELRKALSFLIHYQRASGQSFRIGQYYWSGKNHWHIHADTDRGKGAMLAYYYDSPATSYSFGSNPAKDEKFVPFTELTNQA